jgi:hypothetical protein
MSFMDKDIALEVLAEVSDYLQGHEFFLDAGTLLGIYRNGEFIDHDTDIDFAIIIDPTKQMVFPTPDWQLVAVWNYRNLPMQRAYLYKGIVVDFYFYYSNFEEGIILNHNDHGVLRLKSEYCESPTLFDFKNMKVRLPGRPEKVLESEYGDDWRIPKHSKGDWGDDRRNLYREFPLWPVRLEGISANEVLTESYSIYKSEVEVLRLSIVELTQQRDELTKQRDELTKQRDELINSTIWRVTKPLRDSINFLKK